MPITPGRLRSLFFRSARRSSEPTPAEAMALAAIEAWECPFSGKAPHEVPVHVVTSGRDWRLAAWMLASWFHFTERAWKVVIHDDGTLSDAMAASLQKIFPAARILRRREADAVVAPDLIPFPFCGTYRSDDPLALKLFDARHFCEADRFFVFDSDVLFLNHPRELLDWADGAEKGCWFAEGNDEHSLIDARHARDELNVQIWPRVDAGISLLQKKAIDLDFIDAALAETAILRGSLVYATQTVAMLCAARAGNGGLLPKRYTVTRERDVPEESVSRHYTGESRPRFYEEGLKRLGPHLFCE